MKKFLALALVLCLCVCMSATAFAADIVNADMILQIFAD